MQGIVNEILALNKKFFDLIESNSNMGLEEYILKVEELEEEKGNISFKLSRKTEALVDFLYRDYPDVYKKMLVEASCAEDNDKEFFPTDFEKLDDPELVESYILASLSYDYDHKGETFTQIFEGNFFAKEEEEAIF